MATTSIQPAQIEDLDRLVAGMRYEDVQEVMSQGSSPREAAEESLRTSEVAWSVWHGDQLLAMFGVRSDDAISGYACVWLLSTAAVERARAAFYKASLCWIQLLGERWPVLYNFVDVRYTRAVEWLKRLGFKIEAEAIFGGVPFYKMVRREG